MAKFFTSPEALSQWLKDNNGTAHEAATRLMNIIQDDKYEQDIGESCRRIFAGNDDGASGVLHGLLSKYEITETIVAEVNEKMKKIYAANELHRNNSITAETRDKMIRQAQIMRQPGQYDMPLRICPKLPKQSAGQGLISTYNCRHYCLDSIVFDDDPLRVVCAEALWRRHVMDKFSREWQDPKTGKLVGGYINERFYVFPDAGTPANPGTARDQGNNMALAPNERSRVARPHEYSIERRMQEAREKGSTKPITLRTASAAKKISNCCSAEDRLQSIDGPSFSEVGICPRCKEHCEFIFPAEEHEIVEAKSKKSPEKHEQHEGCVLDVKKEHPVRESASAAMTVFASTNREAMIPLSADILKSAKADDKVFSVYSTAIDLHNKRMPAHEAAILLKEQSGLSLGTVVRIQEMAMKKMASHQADVYVTAGDNVETACPSCGKKSFSTKCESCGKPKTRECSHCGKTGLSDWCDHCGRARGGSPDVTAQVVDTVDIHDAAMETGLADKKPRFNPGKPKSELPCEKCGSMKCRCHAWDNKETSCPSCGKKGLSTWCGFCEKDKKSQISRDA